MQVSRTGSKACVLGSVLLFGIPAVAFAAETHASVKHATHLSTPHVWRVSTRAVAWTSHFGRIQNVAFTQVAPAHRRTSKGIAQGSYGISCVPYARQVSGIAVAGNAWQWWDNAAGQYARGDQPEAGSVLNFRANGRMRLGHVAVVSRVVNAREIIVDQANWPSAGMRGGVSHDVAVVDVSEANNWSAVRVELGRDGEYGSVYPTYGFIYNRPDQGVVTASVSRPAPQPHINPVPSDLRPVAQRPWKLYEEVAESPAMPARRIDLSVTPSGGRLGN
jgi:surface antigen